MRDAETRRDAGASGPGGDLPYLRCDRAAAGWGQMNTYLPDFAKKKLGIGTSTSP